MAAGGDPAATLREEATCSICLDYFQEPVMIAGCGHNFCRACIAQYREKGPGAPDGSHQCPQCRRTFSQDRLVPNRPLKNMVATISQLSQLSLSSSQGAVGRSKGGSAPPHDLTARPPKLDPFPPPAPLVGGPPRDRLCCGAATTRVKDQFRPRGASSPHGSLRHPGDHPGLLQQGGAAASAPAGRPGCQDRRTPAAATSSALSRTGMEGSAGTRPGTYVQPQILANILEVTQALNNYLQPSGRASSGYKSKSKWKDENVLLDPETAHPRYVVSNDQKSVWWGDVRQIFFPSNSKRFEYARCILGTKGFASGKHRWTVDVGDDGDWAVGVALESVNRDEELDFEPDEGIWAIARYGNEYKALTCPRTSLELDYEPTEIRVCLNYGAGSVAFYDAEDNTRLYSFQSVDFEGEKVFPFFRIINSSTTLQLS